MEQQVGPIYRVTLRFVATVYIIVNRFRQRLRSGQCHKKLMSAVSSYHINALYRGRQFEGMV
jgi:hypothetical protein